MNVRLLLLATLLGLFLYSQSQPQNPSIPSPSSLPESATPATQPKPVRVHAYDEQDRLFSQSWAIPVPGGYVAIRSMLAQAHRAELVHGEDRREPISQVGGEDVEANLVFVKGTDAPAAVVTPANLEADTPSNLSITCAGVSIAVDSLKARDIPVFGVAWVGMTKHRDSVSGCPAFDAEEQWRGIVAWDNSFGKPTVALVPSTRATGLGSAPLRPWDTWHSAQLHPDKRLRDSLLADGVQDLWREDYRTATATFSYLIENDIDSARAWYYRGFAKAMQGRRKEATMDYEHAVSKSPENAEMRFSLGLSQAMLLNIPEAEKHLAVLETLDEPLARRLAVIIVSLRHSDHEHGHEDEPAKTDPDSSAPEAGASNTPPKRY